MKVWGGSELMVAMKGDRGGGRSALREEVRNEREDGGGLGRTGQSSCESLGEGESTKRPTS